MLKQADVFILLAVGISSRCRVFSGFLAKERRAVHRNMGALDSLLLESTSN